MSRQAVARGVAAFRDFAAGYRARYHAGDDPASRERRAAIARGMTALGAPTGEVAHVFDRLLRGKGRVAVRAAGNLIAHLPPLLWAPVLHEAFALRLDREAWRWMLHVAWHSHCTETQRAAGDVATLVAWFRYADFPSTTLPFLRSRLDLSPVPDVQVAYRGGVVDPRELARGWSWTPYLATAGIYAHDHPAGLREILPAGKPVILRRIVRREEVVVKVGALGQELIVVPPEGAALDAITVETDDQEAIGALCDSLAEEWAKAEARRLALVETPEEQLWQDWGA